MNGTTKLKSWNGAFLRGLREGHGLSRRQLRSKVEVLRPKPPAERTIQRWEDGETVPGADDLAALAAIFGCGVGDFFSDSEGAAA